MPIASNFNQEIVSTYSYRFMFAGVYFTMEVDVVLSEVGAHDEVLGGSAELEFDVVLDGRGARLAVGRTLLTTHLAAPITPYGAGGISQATKTPWI